MSWRQRLRAVFTRKERPLEPLTAEQMRELAKEHSEVQVDEGATGNPFDYLDGLMFAPPSRVAIPVNDALCGCCSALFLVNAKIGIWIASGRKDIRPLPLCAVCIQYLNHHRPRTAPLALPAEYDPLGQQLADRFPGEDPRKVAVVRLAIVRARLNRDR